MSCPSCNIFYVKFPNLLSVVKHDNRIMKKKLNKPNTRSPYIIHVQNIHKNTSVLRIPCTLCICSMHNQRQQWNAWFIKFSNFAYCGCGRARLRAKQPWLWLGRHVKNSFIPRRFFSKNTQIQKFLPKNVKNMFLYDF